MVFLLCSLIEYPYETLIYFFTYVRRIRSRTVYHSSIFFIEFLLIYGVKVRMKDPTSKNKTNIVGGEMSIIPNVNIVNTLKNPINGKTLYYKNTYADDLKTTSSLIFSLRKVPVSLSCEVSCTINKSD